jgi:rubrerythrin
MRIERTMDVLLVKLGDVIELDFDAIAAYRAAVERLDDPLCKEALQQFMADHTRHVRTFSDVIRRAGGVPPRRADAREILVRGQVVIAGLAGDEAILRAMKDNEEHTNSLYEDVLREGYPEDVHGLLHKALADERRHRDWIGTTLATRFAPDAAHSAAVA